jgi:hypothetical protein
VTRWRTTSHTCPQRILGRAHPLHSGAATCWFLFVKGLVENMEVLTCTWQHPWLTTHILPCLDCPPDGEISCWCSHACRWLLLLAAVLLLVQLLIPSCSVQDQPLTAMAYCQHTSTSCTPATHGVTQSTIHRYAPWPPPGILVSCPGGWMRRGRAAGICLPSSLPPTPPSPAPRPMLWT